MPASLRVSQAQAKEIARQCYGITGAAERLASLRLDGLRKQVIHTDFHGDNLRVGDRVSGVLDFGDSLAGPIAMDVAVAGCYQSGLLRAIPPDVVENRIRAAPEKS
jgi:Ser/Thr protein kinase RdoA (MazF antagonist)